MHRVKYATIVNMGYKMKLSKAKIDILEAGIKLWHKDPSFVTLAHISRALKKLPPALHYHFPNGSIKDAVAEYAVSKGDSIIIVHLILSKHPSIHHLSESEIKNHFTMARP